MKKALFIFLVIIFSSAKAQEFSGSNSFSFPNNGFDNFISLRNATSLTHFYGLQIKKREFSIPQGSVYGEDVKKTIDMQGMAWAKERQKQLAADRYEFPENQISQMNSNVKIFVNQFNFDRRTNSDFNYNGTTPDGGIRNEVYESQERPFYFTPYYRSNSYHRRSNRPTFHITRY
ncbi:hypothetical protein ACFQ3R_04760 [Mesonia ostreae]|uniref:Uncharacterized protein n=1 Tax=Mesonia ostreae TaxID=861110 RepID=A0ABU2KK77_9FLAO|nr:hypothetical protein [Mesonia ostreae]MDT0295125.1 hypothetical protein [Mesonia ostreae]